MTTLASVAATWEVWRIGLVVFGIWAVRGIRLAAGSSVLARVALALVIIGTLGDCAVRIYVLSDIACAALGGRRAVVICIPAGADCSSRSVDAPVST